MSDLPKPIEACLEFFQENKENENIGYYSDLVRGWLDGFEQNRKAEALKDDPRIVLGINCTWWDSIDKTAIHAAGFPVCPDCGGPLLEVVNEESWWKGQDPAANKQCVEWGRGKCFPSHTERFKAYLKARGMGSGKARFA